MKLSGNTVLITGGASGIGLAMADAFLAAGSTVIICGRREALLLRVQETRPCLHVRCCDVSRLCDCRSLAQWVMDEHPECNVLVNNAGIQRDIDLTAGLDAYLAGESEIRVNLEAPIVLCTLFIPHLAKARAPAIVNVSSGLGFVPAARTPVYSASKAGVHAFTMALRHQVAGLGIEVVEIVPPAVDTGLNPEGRAQRGSFKPDLTPETFVAKVMKGLAGGASEIGYGMTEDMLHASRADLDRRFEEINSRC